MEVLIAYRNSCWEVVDGMCVELQNRLQKHVKARRAMEEKPPVVPSGAEN